MPKSMVPYNEFRGIMNAMLSAPRKDDETQRAHFARLKEDFNITRSRTVLQLVEKAIGKDTDPEKSYENYKKLSRERTEKRQDKEKQLSIFSEQQFDSEVTKPAPQKEVIEICGLVIEISIKGRV